MVWAFWKRWQSLHDRRRSMGWMLLRKDDRWLKDIGMTRNDLRVLLEEWEEWGKASRSLSRHLLS